MWYVYILKSKKKDWRYTGSTNNLNQRFKDHNKGQVQSTKHYVPFEIEAYVAVNSEHKARELEKYFETGSDGCFISYDLSLPSATFFLII